MLQFLEPGTWREERYYITIYLDAALEELVQLVCLSRRRLWVRIPYAVLYNAV